MSVILPVSKRGTVTLPPDIRRKLGLDRMENPLVIIEERDGAVVLQPAAAIPVRDLPKETLQAWVAEDEAAMQEYRSKPQ